MMTWGVPTDCSGNPEADVAFYSVYLMAVLISGWYDCGGGSLCPIYSRSDWMLLGTTEDRIWGPLSDPPLGGVNIYDVKATNSLGHQHEECP